MYVRGRLHHWPRVVTRHSVLRYSYREACAPGAVVSIAMSCSRRTVACLSSRSRARTRDMLATLSRSHSRRRESGKEAIFPAVLGDVAMLVAMARGIHATKGVRRLHVH